MLLIPTQENDMPRRKAEPTSDVMAPLSLRFTQPQTKYLIAESKRTGLAMTEIVRRAVDEYRDYHSDKKAA
jgi:hypothetical protein